MQCVWNEIYRLLQAPDDNHFGDHWSTLRVIFFWLNAPLRETEGRGAYCCQVRVGDQTVQELKQWSQSRDTLSSFPKEWQMTNKRAKRKVMPHYCTSGCYFFILSGFWNKILVRIDRVQKELQDSKMNFHEPALDMKALRHHFQDEREIPVSESLDEGLGLCEA